MKPTAGAPIADFFTRLLDIRNQLAGTSQALDDTTIKARIYATLPPEFLTTAIYQQNLPKDTPLESIMDALICDESMRAHTNNPPALKEALFTTGGTTNGAEVEAAEDVEDEAAGGDRPMEPLPVANGAPSASKMHTTPKIAGLDLMTMTATMTMEETAEEILRNVLRNVGSVESLDIFNKIVLSAKRGERQNENLKGANMPRTIQNLPT